MNKIKELSIAIVLLSSMAFPIGRFTSTTLACQIATTALKISLCWSIPISPWLVSLWLVCRRL